MPMVTWGLLTKSAEDSQKIEEAIDAKITDHNADPDAHGLADMALYAHRSGDVLDHINESVKNIKLVKGARAYTFIVDPSGDYDYTNIQDAIDAAENLGRGIILIRPGTYTLSASLVISCNDIVLVGQGATTIITLANAVNDDVIKLVRAGAHLERVTIENLKIDGNGANQTDGRGIDTEKTSDGFWVKNITLRNLEITACKEKAINLDWRSSPKSCLVENNYIHDNLYIGFYIADGEDCLVTNNIVKNNSSIGIYFNSGKHNLAINNRIEGNTTGIRLSNGETHGVISGNLILNVTYDGILLQDDVSHTTIEGNLIGGCQKGIKMTSFSAGVCKFNVISDNIILNSTQESIELWNNTDTAGNNSKNTIVGNTIYKSGYNGIKLRGVQHCVVQGNTFDGTGSSAHNTYADIFLTDNGNATISYSIYNVVEGNNIKCSEANKSKYGIRENDVNNNYNIVVGNIVQGAVTAQISIQGANTEMAHNIE